MPLPYLPRPGEVLICGFDDIAPGAEMIKRRPVVVVSSYRSHSRRLCTVVPLSTTAPEPARAWHHALPSLSIVGWTTTGTIWAKCDMLATVAFERLNAPYLKSRHGGRRHITTTLPETDFEAIRRSIRAYLDL